MKVVALVSGGKDSTYNMMQCVAAGHQLVALAYLVPHSKTEIDSYMYQSVGHEAVDLIAEAMDLPLYKKETMGIANQQGKNYEPTENDEVEDLYFLLEEIKSNVDVEAVSVGAILSDYQRVRVENVCIRLGLIPLAFLWQRNQETLLDEMIKCEVDAIIIKVAALGLEQKHLGRSLSLMQPHLLAMHEKYGLNICGEGGEYETLTLDCPLFKSRLIIEESAVVVHSEGSIAPVAFLKFNKLSLELKLPALDLQSRLEGLPLKTSESYVRDNDDRIEVADDELEEEPGEEEPDVGGSVRRSGFVQKVRSASSGEGWTWVGGVQVFSNEPAAAMHEALLILKSALREHGHTLRDVCAVSLFVGDMSRYAALNRLYVEAFEHPNPPSRACVEVPLSDACPVKLEALSWRGTGGGGGEPPADRHALHVQSRSHWAPANIGPYSQAVRVGDFIHVAGQIGLVPDTLELIAGGVRAQGRLALRHVARLLAAADPNVNLRDVVQGICYVTDVRHVEPARKLWEGRTNNAIMEYVVVTGLPKSALIEWHVWAHKHNNQFEYEERGKCVGDCSVSLYRRVNYENNVTAVVCRAERPSGASPPLAEDSDAFAATVAEDDDAFAAAAAFCVQKLRQGHEDDRNSVYSLKVFYLAGGVREERLVEFLDGYEADISLVYTLVPVVAIKNRRTFISICGVRNE